jgi:hypothetical protein
VATCLRHIEDHSISSSRENFQENQEDLFRTAHRQKTSDLFAEVRYKSSPLIAKINPVNPGDKDKPRLISRTYKLKNGYWMQVRSHSGPKPNAKRANGRTGKRVKRRSERLGERQRRQTTDTE